MVASHCCLLLQPGYAENVRVVMQKVLQVSKLLSSLSRSGFNPYQQVSLKNRASQLSFLYEIFSTFSVTHGGLRSLKIGCYFFGSGCFNVLGLM